MFNNIGPVGLIVLVLLALVLFGPNKLPEFGRSLGKTIREFKKGASDILDTDEKPAAVEEKKEDKQTRLPE
jgi:sec-independent protein translocase protein TatA